MPQSADWLPAALLPYQGNTYSAADCPTALGGVNSITLTITASVMPTEIRVAFRESAAQDVAPFYAISAPGTHTIAATDAVVPADWDVANPGEVGSPDVESIDLLIISQTDDTPFDFCLSDITIN